MMNVISWLTQDPSSSKHRKYFHPITACILHYLVVLLTVFTIHDQVFVPVLGDDYPSGKVGGDRSVMVSRALFSYVTFLFSSRLLVVPSDSERRAIIYEFMWLCNGTLLMSPIALLTGRPLLASSFCVAVSIDQVLWYVDLLVYVLTGFQKFPIGVAKYLTWPDTSWITWITCTHHIWTIPIIMYACSGIHWASFPFSICIVICHVLLSRWLTPFVLPEENNGEKKSGNSHKEKTSKHSKHGGTDRYLNVNLSHELWKDIKFSFLQISHDDPPTAVYLFRLLWRWQLFNLMVFSFVLYPLTWAIFGI